MRDYLRPDEVDAMVQTARTSGRHRVRDAAIIMMMYRHGLRTAELAAWTSVTRVILNLHETITRE